MNNDTGRFVVYVVTCATMVGLYWGFIKRSAKKSEEFRVRLMETYASPFHTVPDIAEEGDGPSV